jgi:hypothetical protein
MKAPLPRLLALFLVAGALPSHGQIGPPPAAPQPVVSLTPEQIEMLSKQLSELESQIDKLRGDTLGQILQKLRAGTTSDAAAMALLADCEKLISVERKELDRDEQRRLEERIERNAKGRAEPDKTEGDIALATRLQLQYLILSLEAHEAKDREPLLPKLQAHIQSVLASSDKLKGRALGQLSGDLRSDRNPFVAAFQLQRYLEIEQWTTNAADLRGMWTQTILPWFQKHQPEQLGAQWDNRITAETTFRQGVLSDAEYTLWLQNDLPALRWERAEYLLKFGTSPVNALADMLKLIKEFPGHADAPKWLTTLRSHIPGANPAGS